MSHNYTTPYIAEAQSTTTSYDSLAYSADWKPRSISDLEHVAISRPSVIKNSRTKIGSAIVDTVCVGLCICMFTFALLAYHADGNNLSSYEKKLMNIARIVTTAFPFIFAFILGRGLHNWLNCRLEKGIDVLSFAYYSRSFTLGGTYMAPFSLRSWHWIPILLALIWAFSPFGSQAALRFTGVVEKSIVSNATRPVQYIYPHATRQTAGADAGEPVNAADALLATALLTGGYNKAQTQDAFGNLKIPAIEAMQKSPGPDGWIPVDSSSSVWHASLLGIPIDVPITNGNSTFELSTWYWRIQDPQMTNSTYKSDPRSSFSLLPPYAPADNSSTFTNFTDKNTMWQFAAPLKYNASTLTSMPFIFEQSNYGVDGPGHDLTHFSGTLIRQAINVSATCVRSSCKVVGIKNATMDDNPQSQFNWTFFNMWFLGYLTKAFPIPHSGTPNPGILESYISNPDINPYTNDPQGYDTRLVLHNRVTAEQLGARLSQVLNTYWIAHAAGSNAAAAFNTTRYAQKYAQFLRTSKATVVNNQEFFHVDKAWLSVLCLATLLIFFAAGLSGVVTWLRIGPDAIDPISALTRADTRLRMDLATTLDADERIRLLKDVELKIGDVYLEENVGGIFIGRGHDVANLEKGRIYR